MLATRIARLAPSGASHYRLRLQMPDGVVRQYPLVPDSFYTVGAAPGPIPAGRYTVHFFDQALRPLQAEGAELLIESLAASLPASNENSVDGASVQGGAVPSSQLAPAETHETAPAAHGTALLSRAELARRLQAEPDPRRRRQLLDAHQEARDIAFIQNSKYVREVGEIFVLGQLMRREMMAMQASILENQRQEYAQIEQVKKALPALWEMQGEVLQHMKQQHARAGSVASSPDYVGLGMDALATVQELGRVVIDRTSAPPGSGEGPRSAGKRDKGRG